MCVQRVNWWTHPGIEMNEKLLSELSERLAAFAAANPAKDLEENFRALLSSAFARLDLAGESIQLLVATEEHWRR